MKKIIIWERPEYQGGNVLLKPEDIKEKVDFFECRAYLFPGLEPTEENRKRLEKMLPELEACEEAYVREMLMEARGLEYTLADDSEEVPAADMLVYFTGDYGNMPSISLMSDLISWRVYEYWDGSNWKEIRFDDSYMEEIEVEYAEDREEDLDQWDGSNFYFRQKFQHGRLYPITKIDGKEVTGKYLLHIWTQYQGDVDEGHIIDEEEAQNLLKEARA